MYEELINRLRTYTNDGTDELRNEAADAIEELSKLADAIPHVCECCIGCEMEKKNGGCDNAFVLSPKRATQYQIKPLWVPVTERLPEETGDYLVYVIGGDFGQLSWFDIDWFNDGEFHGGHYATANPVAWMPLPEPPKEETE